MSDDQIAIACGYAIFDAEAQDDATPRTPQGTRFDLSHNRAKRDN